MHVSQRLQRITECSAITEDLTGAGQIIPVNIINSNINKISKIGDLSDFHRSVDKFIDAALISRHRVV